ncbi:hypothetical protein ACE7GA_25410 [Roseomonas sp. CCTCC AB2023176]|uniref:hypothetical protein n=1 Tax=Roseomonas sp. CCTCC AB2023176 TaxID=3342640 RepID=UPI0035D96E56
MSASLTVTAAEGGSPSNQRRISAFAALVAGLGPLLPLGAMALGLGVPDLAERASAAMPEYVVVAGFCGVLALPAGSVRNHRATVGFALLLGALSPALAWFLAVLAGASADRAAWVALAAAAPVGIGTIGLVAAMGGGSRRTTGMVLASAAGAVAVLPGTALALGIAGLGGGDAALRLLALGVVPALAALAVRRVWVPQEGTRACLALLACASLALQAFARVHGAAAPLASAPAEALLLLAFACIPSLAGILAAVALARLWRGTGIGVAEAALAGGYRNVTVTWVIVAPVLPPEGHLFMALTALPIFATPAIVARVLRRR